MVLGGERLLNQDSVAATGVAARCRAAKAAQTRLAVATTEQKNALLHRIAARLEGDCAAVVEANQRDVAAAADAGLSSALVDRLRLDEKRLRALAASVREVVALPDPVGLVESLWTRPNGLQVGKMRIPLGVIAIIFESRPNVVIDAAILCLKSGNAAILKGGKEAAHTNAALAAVLSSALVDAGLPSEAVTLLTDRGEVGELLHQTETVDLVIPRGGEGLVRYVTENSRIPVVQHYKGVCHVFVDATADLEMASRIVVNAKAQRPGTCNAAETLLVHAEVAERFLPEVARALAAARVTLVGCERTRAVLPEVTPATEADWSTEYLDLVLSVRVVDDLEAALAHISRYGSSHTEAIVTRDYQNAHAFIARVPSSAVLVNASTRFNDGGELGLGAEIGISTSKLHAFGPMGLRELTTTKFIVYGQGQVRA